MGARSRTKGANGERDIARLARSAGLDATRTWHTAQSSDATERACDVRIAGLPVQVKITANGFGSLYGALEGVELLFVRADRHKWLAVVRAEKLLRLLKQSAHGEGNVTASAGRHPCALRRRCYAAATPPPVHANRVPGIEGA